MESQGEPIVDESRDVIRVVGFTRDVTDRKRNEQALQETNDQLDMFTSVVAHDLRNPLNVAQGYVELARETGDVEKLDAVERAHEGMEDLITDLLTLAREGETIDDPEWVDLESIATTRWENVAETGAARLRVEADVRLRCDQSRLGQALENLFRNAVEHGSTSSQPPADDAVEHAGVDVTVTVGLLEGGTGFYVEDDGPGIDEDQRERLLDGEHSGERGQVRFGLAIVQRIVDAHGWDIEITDAENGGARFEITGVELSTSDG
jgi:signal transduction histidine kinase